MRFIFLLMFFPFFGMAQCDTYRLNSQGDTLDCTDVKGLKQGKWVIHVDPIRGEKGYEEEGVFKDGKKWGIWRVYNLMGDLLAEECFKFGVKDGVSKYYTYLGLEHEESWKASNPSQLYDTLLMEDIGHENVYHKRIVKRDLVSRKNGIWKYYRPGSLSLLRTETWVDDNQVVPVLNTELEDRDEKKKVAVRKLKEVEEFEKQNAKKKVIQYRTGETKTD